MEVERYTLATGETAVTGFNRFWKHWGLVFAILVYFANLWPGWAFSSATLATYLFGGSAVVIAICSLLVIGAALTLAPVIYVALERLIFVKVAAVGVLVVLGVIFAIKGESWSALGGGFTSIGTIPPGLSLALVFGAIAFAGAGGGQNLCQSNWIRDKGFGMGQYVPRLVSPVTGEVKALPAAVSYTFEPTPTNMARWQSWWRFANVEQTAQLRPDDGRDHRPDVDAGAFDVVRPAESAQQRRRSSGSRRRCLQNTVGRWFGVLFLAIGSFSLFGSSMGIIDYTSRLAADILKHTYLPKASVTESGLYFWLVWGMVGLGCAILLSGLSQPLTLLVISATTGGLIMFLYSMLLIPLNRTHASAGDSHRSVPPRDADLVGADVRIADRASPFTPRDNCCFTMKALLLTDYKSLVCHRHADVPRSAKTTCWCACARAASAAATSTATTAPPAGESRRSSWDTRPPA